MGIFDLHSVHRLHTGKSFLFFPNSKGIVKEESLSEEVILDAEVAGLVIIARSSFLDKCLVGKQVSSWASVRLW